MIVLEDMQTWFSINKEWVTALCAFATCVLSVATIVISLFSLKFAAKQTKINKELSQLNIAKEQPVFIINTKLEQDTNDDAYGTEHLLVKKIGAYNFIPEIQVTVLFNLTKVQRGQRDSFPVIVGDYFNTTSVGRPDEGIVYHTFRTGNKRLFYELYMEAVQDKSENGVHYWFDEICLVRIEYTDLLHTRHAKYFVDKEEVGASQFQNVLSKASQEKYNLKELDYKTIKSKLSYAL